ncbi:MAG: Ni/Fe hydrogenase subunit alpha [Gammaproteobacteria bacterium]|nr:Ni/Fe hydrogenase subunit alpha [Gammaproteobacteria bacterium]
MTKTREVSVNVPVLARVEGEGALELVVAGGRIETLKLRIFEAPRLFEKFLEGRGFAEVPDMVARICGICPVAYQMSAVNAIEGILGVEPGPWVQAMRRVLYCGEWIQSHALHVHLLAAPDFLGYESAIAMARDHPDAVRRGMRLQALGNAVITLLGARSVHPVGVRVGGFHRAPPPEEVAALRARLEAAIPEAEALVRWASGLGVPDDAQSFTSVALRHPEEYPMSAGRLSSSAGHDVPIERFERHVAEHQVAHSTALHSLLDGEPYLVGPLARLNLNRDRLPGPVRDLADEVGPPLPSRNMFHSLVARTVEILLAVREAARLLADYRLPRAAFAKARPRAGVGFGCTEAPRGILWHRYELDAGGRVVSARIVPPTSQNQARIEADLRRSLEAFGLDRGAAELRARAERVIRNYDPCISCATHFLRVRVRRR